MTNFQARSTRKRIFKKEKYFYQYNQQKFCSLSLSLSTHTHTYTRKMQLTAEQLHDFICTQYLYLLVRVRVGCILRPVSPHQEPRIFYRHSPCPFHEYVPVSFTYLPLFLSLSLSLYVREPGLLIGCTFASDFPVL